MDAMGLKIWKLHTKDRCTTSTNMHAKFQPPTSIWRGDVREKAFFSVTVGKTPHLYPPNRRRRLIFRYIMQLDFI